MKKVVVERPRGQSYAPSRKFGARLPYLPDHDYDEQPKRVGISASYRDYGYSEKWFRDLLGPLTRFLQKNVGRPWDEVYSEVCATLDRREITGHHLISHLKDEVETNCFMGANRKVWYLRWGSDLREVDGFYVHPQTGLLCRALRPNKRELKRRQLLAEEVTWLVSDDETGYRKWKGLWYRVQIKHVFVHRRQMPGIVHDIFLKKDVWLNYGWNSVSIAKKQCNRDELLRVRYLLWERERRIKNM